jgi:glycosyltransferase involved in cell wall biosynthesis
MTDTAGSTLRPPAVWLSWHDGSRSRSLSTLLGLCFRVFADRRKGFLRHFLGTFWTIREVWRLRPSTMFLQNSFMLLLVASLYKCWSKNRPVLVADCHNKSLKKRLRGPLGTLFFAIKTWSFRQADLVIVSNDAMLGPAEELSDRVLVLRDPLPVDFMAPAITPVEIESPAEFVPPSPYILFSCSFGEDEPVESILLAAAELSRVSHSVVITGDTSKLNLPESIRATPGVFMPGYVSNSCYRGLVAQASAVVALTEDDDCLMCAAYEGIAARRPVVVSDTSVLRACFGDSATYTSNQVGAIVSAVNRVLSAANNQDSEDARAQFELAFEAEFRQLLTRLSDLGAIGSWEVPKP